MMEHFFIYLALLELLADALGVRKKCQIYIGC